jgi:glutamate-1-semialdehyde aminotransferase
MKTRTGVQLYKKAKNLIAGGTNLISKRPERFLPDQWPTYYRWCKGAEIEDLDGNRYIDMSINGVGTCILGYADPDVDNAVKKAIDSGTMCTLNCPEEVDLAELLIELHPWAEMVRYARGGGEAMAVAIRLARAATGRDKIAFCGYHGWHDWYLAANIQKKSNLDPYLLKGLDFKGVPKGLADTAFPFNYNNNKELEEIVTSYGDEIAAIVMEPVRQIDASPLFLEKVKKTAEKIGAVLIFDEVTSGWRSNVGGIHMKYGVEPHLCVFAKGISNGYPMGAIIGTKDVMAHIQETFISSTYWTEKIGPVAALATINKIQKYNVPQHLKDIGAQVQHIWQQYANEYDIDIKIMGIEPLSHFKFCLGTEQEEKSLTTLFIQELLKKGFLASCSCYTTYAHNENMIQKYETAIEVVFRKLKDCIVNKNIDDYLEGPVLTTGFQRLN